MRSHQPQLRGMATGPVIRLRLATLFAAQFFDFATFAVMVRRHGIGAELNPIVAEGFTAFGLPMVALVKLALIVLVGAVVVILDSEGARRRRRLGWSAIVTAIAVAAGLTGAISNVFALPITV